MSQVSLIQTNFNGGVISPRSLGRVDLAKYLTSCKTLSNYIVTVMGAAVKRSGTIHHAEVKDSSKLTILKKFKVGVDAIYLMEMGENYIRFHTANGSIFETAVVVSGITSAVSGIVTATGHGYSDGDEIEMEDIVGMTELNDRRVIVRASTTNTFEMDDLFGDAIDTSGFTSYTSGGNAYKVFEVVTTYAETELRDIHVAQSADVMYMAHPDHAPAKLSRTTPTTFTLTDVAFDWPAFMDENVDDTLTIMAGAVTGTTTITASSAYFDAAMVGSHVRIAELPESTVELWEGAKAYSLGDFSRYNGNVYKVTTAGTSGTNPPVHLVGTENDGTGNVDWLYMHSGSGYAEITGFTSSTVISVTVKSRLPESALLGTFRWNEGAWSDHRGYPRTVGFYETRLWWGGSAAEPQTLSASKTNSFEDHEGGTVDDDGLRYTINTDDVNVIEWISPSKILHIGSSGGEFTASGNTRDEPITPTSIKINRETTHGSKHLQPLAIGASVIFVQRKGLKLREYIYEYSIDRYEAGDMTLFAEGITSPGLVEITYQQEPHQLIWGVTAAGGLVSVVYDRTQEVIGWMNFDIGGADVVVESHESMPDANESIDQLWVIVSRTINGVTKRYIERLDDTFAVGGDINDAHFTDCGVKYSGVSTTTVGGLHHMEGETVNVLADGAVIADKTVVGGEITLTTAASKVSAGYTVSGVLGLNRLNGGARDGTSQGKTQRITDIVVKLLDTGAGIEYGDGDTYFKIPSRKSNDLMDAPVPLFTGDTDTVSWGGRYSQNETVHIRHATPLPCTLLAIIPQVVTQDQR